MSVRVCTHCHRPFWHYKKTDIPGRYCAWDCYFKRRKPMYFVSADLAPADPNDIRDVLRLHLEKAHGTSDLTKWFESCQICERLNEAIVIAQRSMV